jgi:hypothetical protein
MTCTVGDSTILATRVLARIGSGGQDTDTGYGYYRTVLTPVFDAGLSVAIPVLRLAARTPHTFEPATRPARCV